MTRSLIAKACSAIILASLVGGCGFKEDLTKARDVIAEVCEREGGRLFLGTSIGTFGVSTINVGCLYPEGKFPKYNLN